MPVLDTRTDRVLHGVLTPCRRSQEVQQIEAIDDSNKESSQHGQHHPPSHDGEQSQPDEGAEDLLDLNGETAQILRLIWVAERVCRHYPKIHRPYTTARHGPHYRECIRHCKSNAKVGHLHQHVDEGECPAEVGSAHFLLNVRCSHREEQHHQHSEDAVGHVHGCEQAPYWG